jgi:hypothetical protein
MGTGAIIGISVGGGVIVLIIIIVLLTRGGGGSKVPRQCGGCQRVMRADWAKCMFCGWTPVPRIEFLTGPLAGQTVNLSEEVTTVGSVAGNHIVLADPAVSRKHVGFHRGPDGGYEVADLGSTNGVYCNGHRMPKKSLVSGDIVRVGNTEMVFKKE